MAQVKFYRGKKEDYVLDEHIDGVYFATDTEEVVMNGKEYGKDPDWNEIESVLGNPLTKVWFVDGTTQEIDLDSIYGNVDGDGAITPTTQFAQGAENIAKIEIGTNVTSIGNFTFSDCTGLTSVNIGNSVTSIGYRAFLGCSGLTSINIPDSVTSIGEYAFFGCSGLTSVTYKGTEYTSKSAIKSALTNNGVTVGNNIFDSTNLTD